MRRINSAFFTTEPVERLLFHQRIADSRMAAALLYFQNFPAAQTFFAVDVIQSLRVVVQQFKHRFDAGQKGSGRNVGRHAYSLR